jgi:hypothetical protein
MPAVWIPESRGPPEQTTCFKCRRIGHYRRNCKDSLNAADSRAKSSPQSSSTDGVLGMLLSLVQQLQAKMDSVSARVDKLSADRTYADAVKSGQIKDNAKPALQLSLAPDIESQFLSSPAGQRLLRQIETLVAENAALRFELQQRDECDDGYYPSEMQQDYVTQLPLLELEQSGSNNSKIPKIPELKALTPSAPVTTTITPVSDTRLSTDIQHADSGATSLPTVEKKARTPIFSATPAANATTTPGTDSKRRTDTVPGSVPTEQQATAQNQTLTSAPVLPTLAVAKSTPVLRPAAPEFLISATSRFRADGFCYCVGAQKDHQHLFSHCPGVRVLFRSLLPDLSRDEALEECHSQLFLQLYALQTKDDVDSGAAAAAKDLYDRLSVFDPTCVHCHAYFGQDKETVELFRRAFAIDTDIGRCIAPDTSSCGCDEMRHDG